MKKIPQTWFGAVIGLALVLAIPMHASSRKQLSPETKEKLNQLVKQHAKLDQLGAKPRFMRGHGASSALHQAATAAAAAGGGKNSDGIVSVPHFDFTATAGGQQFPLMFVGGSPSNGRSTSVRNVIIPISITVPLLDADQNFTGNEVTFDGSTKVTNTIHSPIYRSANFAVDPKAGKTQWGDAMQRVTFFNSLKSNTNSWHVLLNNPVVASTVNTADFFDAFAIDFGDGTPLFAFVAGEYIDGIIASYLATNPLPPDVLPIFVTYNALLFYGGDPVNGCCVLGYHDALVTGTHGNNLVVQTFLFADWNDADIFSVPIQDIHALSHEVAEWAK